MNLVTLYEYVHFLVSFLMNLVTLYEYGLGEDTVCAETSSSKYVFEICVCVCVCLYFRHTHAQRLSKTSSR
jgi:hypothetical protein